MEALIGIIYGSALSRSKAASGNAAASWCLPECLTPKGRGLSQARQAQRRSYSLSGLHFYRADIHKFCDTYNYFFLTISKVDFDFSLPILYISFRQRTMPRKQPPRSYESGENQEVDTSTLRTLAEQLRIIQRDVSTAKTQAAEAKAENSALKRQLQLQAQSSGSISLKSKGNQAQFDANVAVLNELIRALTALEEGHEGEIEEFIRSAIKLINFSKTSR
jgi:hypothetical protein